MLLLKNGAVVHFILNEAIESLQMYLFRPSYRRRVILLSFQRGTPWAGYPCSCGPTMFENA